MNKEQKYLNGQWAKYLNGQKYLKVFELPR